MALPEGAHDTTPPRASFGNGAYVERRTIRRVGGLAGLTIAIQGTFGDVNRRAGAHRNAGWGRTDRTADAHEDVVRRRGHARRRRGRGQLSCALGVEHILFGFDHLLFVLALVILVRDWRRVVLTVTAFTLAHSITLAAATLGFVNVPGPPIEAAIALSIVLVAVEIVNEQRGKSSVAARWPWLIAFCFGLLHGFGFAGALAEVGLPQHAIPVALLFFNLGVEAGQLAFVAVVLVAGWAFQRTISFRFEPAVVLKVVNRLNMIATYAIGAVAAYWLIERTSAMFA